MYDYDYEEDVMLALRFLKRLHQTNSHALSAALEGCEIFNSDMIYELMLPAFSNLFLDYESDWDEENSTEILHLAHPIWDRFLVLSQEWSDLTGIPQGAGRQKFEDLVVFFVADVGDSVYNTAFRYAGNSVLVEMWMSPDCYEVSLFINIMMDLLCYIQQECAHLEVLISKARSDGSGHVAESMKKESV